MKKVTHWDIVETQRTLSLREMKDKMVAIEDFKNKVSLEEIFCRQKSKELWLKEGDKNTGVFHIMTNAHKRQSQIQKMRVNGVWFTKQNSMRQNSLESQF